MFDLPGLRPARERVPLSLRELSRLSGVAADTLVDLERGRRKARPSTVRKLAEALGVTPADLIGTNEKPAASEPAAGGNDAAPGPTASATSGGA